MADRVLLDTNIIVRFLANDHPDHSRESTCIISRLKEGSAVAE